MCLTIVTQTFTNLFIYFFTPWQNRQVFYSVRIPFMCNCARHVEPSVKMIWRRFKELLYPLTSSEVGLLSYSWNLTVIEILLLTPFNARTSSCKLSENPNRCTSSKSVLNPTCVWLFCCVGYIVCSVSSIFSYFCKHFVTSVLRSATETNACLRSVFFVSGSRMTAALLCFLLAGPVLLVAGSPFHDSNNGTIPVVLWHGMGKGADHYHTARIKNITFHRSELSSWNYEQNSFLRDNFYPELFV